MNSIALALVLFAAVLHASWNFVSKKSGGGSSFVLLYETFAFLIYMPLLYLVDFKRLLTLPLEMWLLIILSAVLHVIYTIVLQTGYRKADYSVVYPTARGTGPAFTVLVAVFLFGEKLASLGFAGIACVLLGIVLLAFPGKDKQLKSSLSEGLFWGVLTGVFIASYSSLDGFAIQLIGLTLPLEMWLLIILSAVLHVIYTIVLQTGYRKADYSVVYPTARGTGPAFTVLVAVFLFGEKLASLGFAGIACVLLGIVLLAFPGKDKQLKSSLSEGLFWGVLTGVFIASYSSLDGFAIQLIGLTPLMYYVPGMAVRLLLLGPGILSKKSGRESFMEDIKKRWRYALYIGIAHPAAYLLVLFALLYAPLAYVAPTREVSMMLALFIGAKALHEKVTPLKTAGVLAMMTGVIFISLAR